MRTKRTSRAKSKEPASDLAEETSPDATSMMRPCESRRASSIQMEWKVEVELHARTHSMHPRDRGRRRGAPRRRALRRASARSPRLQRTLEP